MSIEIVKKNGNTEVWISLKSKDGSGVSICLNNLANERGPITKTSMLKAIAEYLDDE